MNEEVRRKLLLIAFMLNGMTALIYEVTWIRPLQLIFGSTIYAVSTMLTSLLIGFALGSYLLRNKADEAKSPILLFAKLELGIGLYGLIILQLFKILPSIYLSISASGLQFLQFGLCFIVLIIPAILFGGTWPVVNKAYVKELGKDVGRLYSINSLGAALGSIAAGFILIPLLGIKLTVISTAILNLFIAIIIFSYSRINLKKAAITAATLLLALLSISLVNASSVCKNFQDDVIWYSGFSPDDSVTSYYKWSPQKCPEDDCYISNINLYTRVIDQNLYSKAYVQITDNCEEPSKAVYSRYAAYYKGKGEEVTLDWNCGTNTNNVCKLKENEFTSECYSIKLSADKQTIIDVFRVNYAWCWTDTEIEENSFVFWIISIPLLVVLFFIILKILGGKKKRKK